MRDYATIQEEERAKERLSRIPLEGVGLQYEADYCETSEQTYAECEFIWLQVNS